MRLVPAGVSSSSPLYPNHGNYLNHQKKTPEMTRIGEQQPLAQARSSHQNQQNYNKKTG